MRKTFLFLAVVLALPIAALYGFAWKYFTHSGLPNTSEQLVSIDDHSQIAVYTRAPNQTKLEIIYIHGSPGSAGLFYREFSELTPNAKLVAYDRPGFGRSSGAREKPSLGQQVRALAPLLHDKAPGERRILVGHSYGAPVALKAALENPEKIDGIILVGAALDPNEEHVPEFEYLANTPVIAALLPSSLRTANRELIYLKENLLDLQKEIPTLTRPILMVHGTEDNTVPVSNVSYLEKQLRSAHKEMYLEKLIFPGYNHAIPFEHPEAIEQAIRMMIDRIGRQEN